MAKTLRVTAPYVTLKVSDPSRGTFIQGYYAGAVVQGVDDESARHHLDNDLAVEVADDAAPEAHPEIPADAPLTPVVAGEPAGNASREAWAEFARSKGATDVDMVDGDGEPLGRDALKATYGTQS